MASIVFNFGYLGLFVVSYLSATVVPFSEQFAVVGMLTLGYSAVIIVIVATAGSFLGALTNYFVGQKGSEFVFSRYISIDEKNLNRAEGFFGRWGSFVLLFSWLPLLGDAITVVAGVLHLDLRVFTIWVLIGRLARQIIVVLLATHIISLPWPEICLGTLCIGQ